MNGNWNWMIGRRFSLGKVIDVSDDTATVQYRNSEIKILICDLLHEDYRAQDRHEASWSEALNMGNGGYLP